tara:strand:+ start:3594 stop:4598 length:1005 start_codon:yes stop_codon:yes gene_type:complete
MSGSEFGDNTKISGSLAVTGSATFNEHSKDVDFRIESDNRDYAVYVDAGNDRVGLGCFTTPNHNIEIHHEGGDGDEGIMIIRYDGAVYPDNILGGIGFDSADGNRPSRTTEASAYIAGYASEHHSTLDKGGYLVFGTAPDDQDDDTTSTERMRISSAGNVGIGTTAPQNPLDLYEMGGLILGATILTNSGASSYAEYDVTTSMVVPNTNWKVTFTAPASGKVEIQFQGYCHSDTGANFDFLYLGLSDASSWNSIGTRFVKKVRVPSNDTASSSHEILTHSWYLNGLTAGTSYTYYVGTAGRTTGHTWKWGGTDEAEYPDLFIRAVSLPNTISTD